MRRLPKEDRAGLYITVIIHLVVLIILLAAQLGTAIKKESSFVLDFTKLEELEKLQKEIDFKQAVSRRLEEMIAEAGGMPVRNVAVDRGALKDDRGTDADQLYKDAERLQKELNSGYKADDYADVAPEKKETRQEKKESAKYSGLSVLSWELAGRKASHLHNPAYRCMGAGEVKVIIGVNNHGDVVSATIDEATSSKDGCLRNFAIRAARMSKFSSSASAPARQMGNIVYQFIAQ